MQRVLRTEPSCVTGASEKAAWGGGGWLSLASKDGEAAKTRREGKRTLQARGKD